MLLKKKKKKETFKLCQLEVDVNEPTLFAKNSAGSCGVCGVAFLSPTLLVSSEILGS